MTLRALAVAGASLLLLTAASRETLATDYLMGTVSHVRDGDTIVVGSTAIRLKGMTCDELGGALGDAAKIFMEGLVEGRQVSCTLTGHATFDRQEGSCRLSEDEADVAALAISTGICGRCPAFDPAGDYVAAAREAGSYIGAMPRYCKE